MSCLLILLRAATYPRVPENDSGDSGDTCGVAENDSGDSGDTCVDTCVSGTDDDDFPRLLFFFFFFRLDLDIFRFWGWRCNCVASSKSPSESSILPNDNW